jgi:hypothetical protein
MMHSHSPTIIEYARQSRIPRRVLLLLNRQGILHDPLTRVELIGLQFLEQIWGHKEILRPQLSRMPLKARLSFLRTVSLTTKWERYAYTRFYNQKTDSRLSLQTVVEEIQATFLFQLNKGQIERVKAVRNRARVARHRARHRVSTKEHNDYIAQTNKE